MPPLDHLILLLPSPNVPSILSQSFTIHEGGKHADGLTQNWIIPLASGTYLELITFTSKAPKESEERKGHWWGESREGAWIDWCLLGEPRGQLVGSVYVEGVEGGRRKPDGTSLGWKVTFPVIEAGKGRRGSVPFWCVDVGNARGDRVPGASAGEHASGVLGVRRVVLVTGSDEQAEVYAEMYAEIVDGRVKVEDLEEEGKQWAVGLSHPDEKKALEVGLDGASVDVVLRSAKGEKEEKAVRDNHGSPVMASVELWVSHGHQEREIEGTEGGFHVKFVQTT